MALVDMLMRPVARCIARCAALGMALVTVTPAHLVRAAPPSQVAYAPASGAPMAGASPASTARTTRKAKGASARSRSTATIGDRKTRGSARRGRRRAAKAVPVLRYTTPRGEIALAADLQTLLGARTTRGEWGVLVTSLSRGDTLFTQNGDAPMLPASTFKLFTTALAFDRLGPSHQIATDILRDGTVGSDGTLHGTLYLRGGGDPSMSARYSGGAGPDGPMTTLAKLVADAGITKISGDIVGDASAFEAKRIPDGWLARYLNASYAARVSALSLNENLLNVIIAPGRAAGAGVVSLQPATVAYRIINSSRTVAGSRRSRLVVSRQSDGAITVRGTIGSRSEPKVYQVVVDDPALMTTGAFRKALERRGIEVGGSVRTATTPVGATRVASLRSPPLSVLASDMNRESINHIAELLFRNAGRPGSIDGVGSAERGNAALRDFMVHKVGARADAVTAADGSGLSTLDRITARSLVQLLGYANRAPWGREFHQSLPVAGESELLRHRMNATPAQGNLHAKTGTTNEVIALGGYVTALNGELLAFSFLYNGTDRWHARETIDAMGATLADWSR